MMKKTKLIRGGIMALFVLAALLLVYLVVRQTMPDIIPLLRSGDEEALEAYLSRDMSFTGILYMALLQMVQVWSIVISGVIVNVAAGVVYGVWRAFAICLVSSSLAHGISFTLYQRLGKYLDKLLPDNSSDKLDIVAFQNILTDIAWNTKLLRRNQNKFHIFITDQSLDQRVNGTAEFQVTTEADGNNVKSALQGADS